MGSDCLPKVKSEFCQICKVKTERCYETERLIANPVNDSLSSSSIEILFEKTNGPGFPKMISISDDEDDQSMKEFINRQRERLNTEKRLKEDYQLCLEIENQQKVELEKQKESQRQQEQLDNEMARRIQRELINCGQGNDIRNDNE